VLGLHWLDVAVLGIYFLVILYVGVVVGAKKTQSLGDFFVAGGKWGSLVGFVFIFASALGGNEAVVVAKGGYQSGLAGVWYWWAFLIATPVYYLFAVYYRRARVYNLSEFLAMRYGQSVSALFSVLAGLICIINIGMVLLAIAKILAGMIEFHSDFEVNVQVFVWLITFIVAAYVFSGGMMSALLTDLIQGVMCLLILGFIGLPFLWIEAGGFEALKSLPPEVWNMSSENMTIKTIVALNLSALVGGIAAPWIFNWISIAKDEKAASQCGWGHLWKRVITLLFAVYGLLFFAYNTNVLSVLNPALSAQMSADPELAWGITMKQILPAGVLGLLIASFFAAAMSTVDTYATISSAMFVDFLYRRLLRPKESLLHYLKSARVWAVVSVLLAAMSTSFIHNISEYIKLMLNFLSFLGVSIYAAIIWRRANRAGVWASCLMGILSYVVVVAYVMHVQNLNSFAQAIEPAFELAVFWSTTMALVGMLAGCWLGKQESAESVMRFHVILNTPVGAEQRLIDAGIRLPALIDAGLIDEVGDEAVKAEKLRALYAEDAKDKYFGPKSAIELRREPTLPWYIPGFVKVVLGCAALVAVTWAVPPILFGH